MTLHTNSIIQTAKHRGPGRPRLGEEMLPSRVIKLPESQVLWLKRGDGVSASARLRQILNAVASLPWKELPPDPGPGRPIRSSYSVPDRAIEQLQQITGERVMVAAVRRAIRADMAGLLE